MTNKQTKKDRLSAKAKAAARVENSAGGVVFRRTGKGLLVGFIKDSYHKWAFPKGHVEKGETLPSAALRETREEMGIDRAWIIAPLGTVSIWFKDRYDKPGTTVHKYISYFLIETPGNEKGRPENKKTGERVRAIKWVSLARAPKQASYKNILPILKKAAAILSTLSSLRPRR